MSNWSKLIQFSLSIAVMYYLPKVPQIPAPIYGEAIYNITTIKMGNIGFIHTVARFSLFVNLIFVLFNWFLIDHLSINCMRVCISRSLFRI